MLANWGLTRTRVVTEGGRIPTGFSGQFFPVLEAVLLHASWRADDPGVLLSAGSGSMAPLEPVVVKLGSTGQLN